MPADAPALVAAARDLIGGDDERTAGLWPRAAALLGRQAMEVTLAQLWTLTAPGMERTSARCQLLCLGTMLGDRELAGRASATWAGLSSACHHRIYELAPTASELNAWLATVSDLAAAVDTVLASAKAQTPPR